MPAAQTVLFLCTGNYYRSRFAEIYFNWHAGRRGIPYVADSRGLALEPLNPGPMSRNTMRWLESLSIPIPANPALPRAARRQDFEQAGLIVAVKEAEHRPLMQHQFPDWADRVEYWHIHDVDCATPNDALPLLEKQVAELLERLERTWRQQGQQAQQ